MIYNSYVVIVVARPYRRSRNVKYSDGYMYSCRGCESTILVKILLKEKLSASVRNEGADLIF
jgi:hypothetical protein